jgi:hypothetical protein
MEYKLDMSMMFAMHNALRRELVQVARIANQPDGSPATRLRTALGWELFKKFLTVHHQSEDDALWSPLRTRVIGHPDQLALADALEAEHAVIDPLLTAIDAAAAAPDAQRLRATIDELVTMLHAHLVHEEADGLPLIDATLTPEEWRHFADVQANHLRSDAPRYMPWLLDGASLEIQNTITGNFPAPLLAAYHDKWKPQYAALDIWNATGNRI